MNSFTVSCFGAKVTLSLFERQPATTGGPRLQPMTDRRDDYLTVLPDYCAIRSNTLKKVLCRLAANDGVSFVRYGEKSTTPRR
jgi:hypothetical protein